MKLSATSLKPTLGSLPRQPVGSKWRMSSRKSPGHEPDNCSLDESRPTPHPVVEAVHVPVDDDVSRRKKALALILRAAAQTRLPLSQIRWEDDHFAVAAHADAYCISLVRRLA